MRPPRLSDIHDAVDEVPLEELPPYADPDPTEAERTPRACDLHSAMEGWIGNEPPSLTPTPEGPPGLAERGLTPPRPLPYRLDPVLLAAWGAAGVLTGMSAVLVATLIAGWLGYL